jgi:hypothetical protein
MVRSKALEGGGCGLFKVIITAFTGDNEENCEKYSLHSHPANIRRGNLVNTSLEF